MQGRFQPSNRRLELCMNIPDFATFPGSTIPTQLHSEDLSGHASYFILPFAPSFASCSLLKSARPRPALHRRQLLQSDFQNGADERVQKFEASSAPTLTAVVCVGKVQAMIVTRQNSCPVPIVWRKPLIYKTDVQSQDFIWLTSFFPINLSLFDTDPL